MRNDEIIVPAGNNVWENGKIKTEKGYVEIPDGLVVPRKLAHILPMSEVKGVRGNVIANYGQITTPDGVIRRNDLVNFEEEARRRHVAEEWIPFVVKYATAINNMDIELMAELSELLRQKDRNPQFEEKLYGHITCFRRAQHLTKEIYTRQSGFSLQGLKDSKYGLYDGTLSLITLLNMSVDGKYSIQKSGGAERLKADINKYYLEPRDLCADQEQLFNSIDETWRRFFQYFGTYDNSVIDTALLFENTNHDRTKCVSLFANEMSGVKEIFEVLPNPPEEGQDRGEETPEQHALAMLGVIAHNLLEKHHNDLHKTMPSLIQLDGSCNDTVTYRDTRKSFRKYQSDVGYGPTLYSLYENTVAHLIYEIKAQGCEKEFDDIFPIELGS